MTSPGDHPEHQVVLVRHAQTAWSESGQHTGTTDLALTDEGRQLTAHLRDRLAGQRFGRVLTSPLERARETAELAGFGGRATPVEDLVEWDYGDYEGRTTADIRTERPGWDLWRDGSPGGETPGDVERRMDGLVEMLREGDGSGPDVVIFGHGHALRALAVRWLDLPIEHGRRLALGTASVSVLGFHREVRVLERWNDRSHLGETD